MAYHGMLGKIEIIHVVFSNFFFFFYHAPQVKRKETSETYVHGFVALISIHLTLHLGCNKYKCDVITGNVTNYT